MQTEQIELTCFFYIFRSIDIKHTISYSNVVEFWEQMRYIHTALKMHKQKPAIAVVSKQVSAFLVILFLH